LLSRGRADEARERAAQTIDIARRNNWVLDIALDTLTLGRAHLTLALQNLANGASAVSASSDARTGAIRLDEAVEGLRASGANHHLARGLLSRAAFRRAAGDWDRAARDLDEVQEIAEPGPMRLYICDCALERARLALAHRESFAPLNGLVAPGPPPPAPPDAAAAAGLGEEARGSMRRASSSPSAATTGATRSSASSTTSSPAGIASPISRRACDLQNYTFCLCLLSS
jgi:hypothetical protein